MIWALIPRSLWLLLSKRAAGVSADVFQTQFLKATGSL